MDELYDIPTNTTLRTTPRFYGALSQNLISTILLNFYDPTAPFSLGYLNTTTQQVTIPQYTNTEFTNLEWISIVGKIGSGGTFTKNMILTQLLEENNIIIEFDPVGSSILPHKSLDNVTQLISNDNSTNDAVMDFSKTVETQLRVQQNTDRDIYVFIDQAHILANQNPILFDRLLNAVASGKIQTVISVTQQINDIQQLINSDTLTDYLWILHRQDSLYGHRKAMGVSNDVESLAIPTETPPEVILKQPDKKGVICSVTPSTDFTEQDVNHN